MSVETLKATYPWPDVSSIRAWDYTLGGQGRHLVDSIILSLPANPVMIEIGCFLGASAKRWLQLRDDLTLIGLDRWDDRLVDISKRYVGRPALTRAYPDIAVQEQFVSDIESQTPYMTCLANLQDYKDRFIPVRGNSPEGLYEIAKTGVKADLVYIDAGKKRDDLEVSHELWPQAHITGDDWHWGRTRDFPMRQVVNGFAQDYGFAVEADHATWILKR